MRIFLLESDPPPSLSLMPSRAGAQAVTHYQDAKIIGEVSKGLGEAMVRYSSLPLVLTRCCHCQQTCCV